MKERPLSQPGRRVVVTGAGVVCAVGEGRKAFWEGLLAGRSGVRAITRFDASPFPTRIAAEVDGFDPLRYVGPKLARRMDRTAHFAVAAAKMAVEDAALDLGAVDHDRTGVLYGTNLGHYDYEFILAQHQKENGGTWVGATLETGMGQFPEAAAGWISTELDLRGPSFISASACSASLDAIGHAFRLIQHGELDTALAGGSQAPISASSVSAFSMVRGMSRRNDDPATACRPFDKERDGFVMGEGGGMVVLETREAAEKRGARIYAEILGYGATCDAYHITNPRPDGRDAARAVRLALDDARVAPEEIDYVNAHGTSTPLNDKTETLVLKSVLGARAHRVPVSAVKSMTGHILGGSSCVELIAALLALEHQTVPPTINYRTPDPDCDLDYVPNAPRPLAMRTVLKNSFGFGGKNSALVVRAV